MRFPRSRRTLIAFGALASLIAGIVTLRIATPARAQATDATPRWIWLGDKPGEDQAVHFRKEFTVPAGVASAKLVAACDNEFALMIDGKQVAAGTEWNDPVAKDVTGAFLGTGRSGRAGGKHVIAARGKNSGGPAGLLVRLEIETRRNGRQAVVSDASWKASESAPEGWADVDFDDKGWAPATPLAKLGEGPWIAVNAAMLAVASQKKEPAAPSPDQFKVAKGFKVERLYTVPKETQGSWVNMTVDPKGRLIVSDQYGKLYRVTPPAIGGDEKETKVEPIEVEIGEAQGLTWAFDSLYVVVNRGDKYPSGLYRVKDTDGDDKLDKVEKLRPLDGGGEHGPHAVIPSPDGKSLYVIAGNATKLTELSGSLVPRLWDEDQILPYMPDGRGFMRDERAPGGCVYRVSPDGKEWVLVSMGYRNPFDMAFNKEGDLFTYDSDMEWDVNTPWYRPTRVCLAASGSDLGYRNGSGKWPTYYPDSLPPVVNIGPGSPTGVAFGYGAKFPAKYQDALYICDWSYGKLYALHLTPEGASYRADVEEFITGTPLPLTDVVVNPTDHAMYFAIGGRKTLSGLYRVTYAGTDPLDAAPQPFDMENNTIRKMLEGFHGRKDPKAVETAWRFLGHPDRFIRYAARVAIEWQDPKTWQDRALAEGNTQAALTALLALARAGDKSLQPKLLDALDRIDVKTLSPAQALEWLRDYELVLIRMGRPDESTLSKLTARLDAMYPARIREQNAELCKLLVYLQSPTVAAKTLPLMLGAPTQEEQIGYATALRLLRAGWTSELRKEYFSWFRLARNFKGGASIGGFMDEIKADAVASLSSEEKTALKPILEAPPESPATVAALQPPRPFVKAWTVEELAGRFEAGAGKRDFDRGRTLFAAAQCFSCHRYDNEGGTVGPDLTVASGRFSPRDLLESIVQPSKSISDQYGAVVVATTDGRVVTGRIVNLNGDSMSINTNMLDPNAQTNVDRRQIEEIKPSTVSMMPEGLLNTLKEDEAFDLLAYLLSRGDRNAKWFR